MITQAIRQLVAEYERDGISAYEINNGRCNEFADEIVKMVDGAEAEWYDEVGEEKFCHCYIKFNGKYYDSECPRGVASNTLLPYYARRERHLLTRVWTG